MAKLASLTAKQVSRGLMSYLEKNNRKGLLNQVVSQVQKAARGNRDDNVAVIETVIPLEEHQIATLSTSLSTQLKRDISVTNTINPSLIAGMKIKVGDLVIDQSYAHHIDQLVSSIHN